MQQRQENKMNKYTSPLISKTETSVWGIRGQSTYLPPYTAEQVMDVVVDIMQKVPNERLLKYLVIRRVKEKTTKEVEKKDPAIWSNFTYVEEHTTEDVEYEIVVYTVPKDSPQQIIDGGQIEDRN